MSSVAQERLASLTKRFHSDRLHHGLLFRGDNLLFLEQAAKKLCQEILKIDEGASSHPDLFHLRPTVRLVSLRLKRHATFLMTFTARVIREVKKWPSFMKWTECAGGSECISENFGRTPAWNLPCSADHPPLLYSTDYSQPYSSG